VAATDVLPERPDPAPLASDAMLMAEDGQRLQLCLEGLSGEQRDAIRTAFFDGITYAELAERRGVPQGTVKSWIRRGLQRLRTCLDDGA
jgi:RNA polymerase sigma factor (sigma-70 family)